MSIKVGSELRKKIQVIISLLIPLLYSGCGDPGYQLRPVGWQSMSDHKWAKHFDEFEIQTRGISGLIGEWWIDPDLQIYNNKKPITLESAKLRTAREEFSATVKDSSTIPPSTSGYRIPVEWKFDQTRAAPKVLGDKCEIVLNLKVGGESRQVKIEYTK